MKTLINLCLIAEKKENMENKTGEANRNLDGY